MLTIKRIGTQQNPARKRVTIRGCAVHSAEFRRGNFVLGRHTGAFEALIGPVVVSVALLRLRFLGWPRELYFLLSHALKLIARNSDSAKFSGDTLVSPLSECLPWNPTKP